MQKEPEHRLVKTDTAFRNGEITDWQTHCSCGWDSPLFATHKHAVDFWYAHRRLLERNPEPVLTILRKSSPYNRRKR